LFVAAQTSWSSADELFGQAASFPLGRWRHNSEITVVSATDANYMLAKDVSLPDFNILIANAL